MTNDQYKILLVDDEDRIRKLLHLYLTREQFEVTEAQNGQQALELALSKDFHCILLDLMLPELSGEEVCQEIRKVKDTPIIMLTAKGEETNRVDGFELGADDYIVKPFSPREVVLRVKALLRRTSEESFSKKSMYTKDLIVFNRLVIDNDSHKVTIDQRDVTLTPKEYELLLFLVKTPDKVYDREDLLKFVWNYEFYGDLRTVDTHIKRLREKMNKVAPGSGQMIATVWGVGYKFEELT